MEAPIVKRFAIASLLVVAFGACGRGDCEGDERILVDADEPCPSPEAAEERFESDHDSPSVDQPATVSLLVPGTICWYLGEVTLGQACTDPGRDVVVRSMKSRFEEPYYFLRACEGEQPLVGDWLPAEATTPREAVAATPAECPPELNSMFIETGELVGQDFVSGTIVCTYHIDYICNGSGGCGAPRGGLQ